MNDCINWRSYWNSKTWNKKHKGGLLGALFAPFAASIVQSMISSVVKGISRRGVRRAGRAYLDKKTFNSAPSFEQYQDY